MSELQILHETLVGVAATLRLAQRELSRLRDEEHVDVRALIDPTLAGTVTATSIEVRRWLRGGT